MSFHQLALLDPDTGVKTGQSSLKYHDIADVFDFLVLRQKFDKAIRCNWQPGERFRAVIGDSWWHGHVEARNL